MLLQFTKGLFTLKRMRYVGYVLIILLGIYLRFVLNDTHILLEYDTPGYLIPSLDCLSGHGFSSVDARSYPYPLLVLCLLFVFGTLSSVVIFQHVIALTGAFLFILYAEKKRIALPSTLLFRILYNLGIFTVLSYLMLNTNLIVFEKTLRPEGLLPALIIMFIYFSSIIVSGSGKRFTILILLTAMAILGSLILPRFILSFAVGWLVVLLNFKGKDLLKQYKYWTFFIIVYVLLLLPEVLFRKNGDQAHKQYLSKQFFYSHAPLFSSALTQGNDMYSGIDAKIAAQISQNTAIKNPVLYPITGYNADDLQYTSTGPMVLNELVYLYAAEKEAEMVSSTSRTDTLHHLREINKLSGQYYYSRSRAMLFNDPWGVMSQAVRQLIYVLLDKDLRQYTFPSAMTFQGGFIVKPHQTESLNYLKSKGKADYHRALEIKTPALLVSFFNITSCILKYLILAGLPLLLLIFAIKRKRFPVVLCITLGMYLGAVFSVAFVHTFEHVRYLQSMLPLTLMLFFEALYGLFLYYKGKV